MTELYADIFRNLGIATAILNNLVAPCYLDDLKRRIAIARVDNRLSLV